jgi:hypothetical protein
VTNFLCTGSGPSETWGAQARGALLRLRTKRVLDGFFLEVNKNYRRGRVPYYPATEEQNGAYPSRAPSKDPPGPTAFSISFDSTYRLSRLRRSGFRRASSRG